MMNTVRPPVQTRSHVKRSWRSLSCIGFLLSCVCGCSHPVAEFALPDDTPAAFSSDGAAPVPASWWLVFEDEELNDLIKQAMTENLDLQTVWDRLAQVEAVARQTGAALWPQADTAGGIARSRQDQAGDVTYRSRYLADVAVRYEVDLWSRLRSQQRAALLDVQAQAEAVNTAAITVSSLVAGTWYQLAEAKALVQITRQQIETNRKVLDVVTVQFQKGQVSAIDVLRQRQLVASTESRLITAQQAVEVVQHVLSVLIGMPPALAWEQTQIALPALPAPPALGVPSEVLWRRPDVRQTYRQVQAADQRVAVAVADQYPRLSLAASVETSSTSFRDLFDDSLANLAGNLVQPLFDAGLRRAEVRRRQAVVSETIHVWRRAILEALQEIETALVQERRQVQLLASLQTQLDLARETYERTRDRYIKGQADYIRVLESLQSLQTLERELILAQRILIERRIALYRATAGGWELSAPAPARVEDLALVVTP
jgi:NodT family efflux transporter outer membrane factor (OMF) lipoprotein